jgi:hypothetical protein
MKKIIFSFSSVFEYDLILARMLLKFLKSVKITPKILLCSTSSTLVFKTENLYADFNRCSGQKCSKKSQR